MSTPRGWGEPARPQIPSAAAPNAGSGSPAGPPNKPSAMGPGELMERVIAAIRSAPRSTWAFGAVVAVLVGLLQLIPIRLAPLDSLLRSPGTHEWGDAAQTEVALLGAQVVGSTLAALVGAAATAIIVAFTARTLARVAAGLPTGPAAILAALRPRLGGLLLLVLLAGLVTTACLTLPALGLALAGGAIGGTGLAAAGAVLGLVVGLLAAIRFVPAVVLAIPEHAVAATSSPASALRRTSALVAGERWRLVGIWLLAVIVLGITGSAISAPLSWIGSLVAPGQLSIWSVLGSIVASAVTAPLGALALSLVHSELADRRGAAPCADSTDSAACTD